MLESSAAPVATLLAAANANETDAFRAMLVEGAVVDGWRTEFAGRRHPRASELTVVT